jgi:predicted NBD/HSP70 family sugar kinase
MSSLGVNAERHRDHNRRLVLQALRRHGALSRADLTRLTALSPQAMSNIAAGLLADSLIRPVGRRRGGRGQPPVGLAINPAGALSLGVDITPAGMTAVLTDLMGTPLARDAVPLRHADPPAVAGALPRLVAPLLAQAGGRAVLGLGVVLPASFPGALAERPTELPGWAGLPDPARFLAEPLDSALPIRVENDATAAAIAAHLCGAARTAGRVACLFLGRGVGLGLVLDGQVYRGATGTAGEVGHVPVVPGGHPCFCGQRGCLEQHVSAHAALRDLGLRQESALDAAAALPAWLDDAAPLLARAVLIIENLFDPDLIVLSGRSDAMVSGLAARCAHLPPALTRRPGPRLVRGASGPFSAAEAAAALPLHEQTSLFPSSRAPGFAADALLAAMETP